MAVYVVIIHLEAAKLLANICQQKGQRAFVKKVCMEQNGAPDYVDTTANSLRDTEALISYSHVAKSPNNVESGSGLSNIRLVNPVITPRFIPTRSLDVLRDLGALLSKYHDEGRL
eukprot:CAMPEP_0171306656 /NCGR_PEP_ID=MMETSP0816-20121228/16687_1 /TAXON_ID=420281 /ORGANISM="Proboscia inermis, Strain CCAP1064/1" /LENGTH=114 /DNA_ID=CAMNT_0011788385 /DNA_START=420 /DNA_END=764 /DNA_ORIENTATION=-